MTDESDPKWLGFKLMSLENDVARLTQERDELRRTLGKVVDLVANCHDCLELSHNEELKTRVRVALGGKEER